MVSFARGSSLLLSSAASIRYCFPISYSSKPCTMLMNSEISSPPSNVKLDPETELSLVSKSDSCRHKNEDPKVEALFVSPRRHNFPFIFGSAPWFGETTALVRQLAVKSVEFEEETARNAISLGLKHSESFEDFLVNEEEKMFRELYSKMTIEEKSRSFVARQVGNRMLGSYGYLCSKCWLPQEDDCMCDRIAPFENSKSAATGIKFWVYLHPKEFLRKNNTGKLLWQIFGTEFATPVICGIDEHEEQMWESLKKAGKGNVWCVYPPKKMEDTCVPEMQITEEYSRKIAKPAPNGPQITSKDESTLLHFILVDGTWNNSKAMVNRLAKQSKKVWPDVGIILVGLSPSIPSIMHELRPQPSKERTCTAGAAAELLRELNQRKELQHQGLLDIASAIDLGLVSLTDALSNRRFRMGQAVVRLGTGKNTGYNENRKMSRWYDRD